MVHILVHLFSLLGFGEKPLLQRQTSGETQNPLEQPWEHTALHMYLFRESCEYPGLQVQVSGAVQVPCIHILVQTGVQMFLVPSGLYPLQQTFKVRTDVVPLMVTLYIYTKTSKNEIFWGYDLLLLFSADSNTTKEQPEGTHDIICDDNQEINSVIHFYCTTPHVATNYDGIHGDQSLNRRATAMMWLIFHRGVHPLLMIHDAGKLFIG